MAQRAKFVPKNKELSSNSDEAASVPITNTIAHFKKNLNFVVFDQQETDKPLGDARGIFNNDDEEFFIRYTVPGTVYQNYICSSRKPQGKLLILFKL